MTKLKNLNHNPFENVTWDDRDELVASIATEEYKRVLDLGCGMQGIRNVLNYYEYVGVDMHKTTSETIIVDLEYTDFSEKFHGFDLVLCLGVMEYLNDPRRFLERASKCGKEIIVSCFEKETPIGYWEQVMTREYLDDWFLNNGFRKAAEVKRGKYSEYVLKYIKK